MNDFDFERADERDTLVQSEGESSGARAYIARVAEEDGAALVGHVARIRRGVSQLCADCFYDLTTNLRAVNPAAASEVRAELEALIIGSQRLGSAAHALDVAATRAHWAAYECAPKASAAPVADVQPSARPAEVGEDETARDEEDEEREPAPAPDKSGRVVTSPAVADMPKIPVTTEGNRQRQQFWAVVNKQGLSSSPAQRDARLAAIGKRIGREVVSINTLTHGEWQDVIAGVEYQSLVW